MALQLQRRHSVRLLVSLVVFAIGALAPAPASAQSGPRSCTIPSQNLFVRDVLDEFYYWYRELPRLNPVDFPSPEAYLEAARFRPLDDSYSYIAPRAATEAFFSASQFIGLGISTRTTDGEIRILQVFPDSPAAEAGLGRGDRVLEIDGRSVADLFASGEIDGAFGPSEVGVSVALRFQTRSGDERRATLVKRVVTIPTVSLTRTFQVDGRTVGYIFFRNFVEPSFEALSDAFAGLREAGATELVLDLRYNGGGIVDVAVHLGSLIGGTVTNGRVFATFEHNDKNARRNETLRFANPSQALTLSRVFVITTRTSASASELIINSLRPHIPVTVIGDTTFGKPVGQYGFTFCDKVVAPVAFKLVNSEGQGDFFSGIPPDCRAGDDIEHDLGSGEEASLAEAFHVIRTGSCSVVPTPRALRVAPAPRPATGWQAVVNAH